MIQYLPVEVESLQQMYSVLCGRDTIRRERLKHLGADRHTSKDHQGSDGKPAPEPRVHAHSKHLVLDKWENRGGVEEIHYDCIIIINA